MLKLLSYPLTVLFFLLFGLVLVIFHPIQWFCLKVLGYDAHKQSVSILNWFIMRCTNVLGTRYSFKNEQNIPTDRPLIIVTNHQSMYDIPPIIWYMRKHHPKFVSKIELGKGIPSVSYNLRHGGSALIDRKDPKQSIAELQKLAKYINQNNRSAVIFPEGTRSRNGEPKPFRTTGLKVMLKNAPSALIVPISINNSWKLLRYGKFPMGLGSQVTFEVHPPIENEGNAHELIAQIESTIVAGIKTNQ
ncbi:1-acyl-sn-glycerol-3-phosphate acyltransferase [Muricauda oceani]|uniref:1-acyl-sn-glycerol-3-phosphate acyltransferase n=1 Tax=Flagellimonas oceani TaxID=2698672 RepID=A0A6G7J7L9_9FLAO|nr:lysophospholipid acyltransferase family protein [Allomuricauda oceani]MBW8243115.1 1-acyl-sn-glycerol-3-phosphate acyltransferase [Allomuricauda oceani]QII46534.1 1-acyl-sn-glycerol-3-phosphate acyltransferase [Allomuricauda oceani]